MLGILQQSANNLGSTDADAAHSDMVDVLPVRAPSDSATALPTWRLLFSRRAALRVLVLLSLLCFCHGSPPRWCAEWVKRGLELAGEADPLRTSTACDDQHSERTKPVSSLRPKPAEYLPAR